MENVISEVMIHLECSVIGVSLAEVLFVYIAQCKTDDVMMMLSYQRIYMNKIPASVYFM